MIIEMQRSRSNRVSTIGRMTVGTKEVITLEDPRQVAKIHGNTRIPAGDYAIKLRREGGMHPQYAKNFPKVHKGMLWLQDVPGFEYVYIHIGNSPKDTLGCILVGQSSGDNFIYSSRAAYLSIYPDIANAIERGEDVILELRDER